MGLARDRLQRLDGVDDRSRLSRLVGLLSPLARRHDLQAGLDRQEDSADQGESCAGLGRHRVGDPGAVHRQPRTSCHAMTVNATSAAQRETGHPGSCSIAETVDRNVSP